MKRIITLDDIIDVYAKLIQRGVSFITSKLSLNTIKRTKSAFNELNIESSNWWNIPKVKERWNFLITGNSQLEYEDFVIKKFLHPTKKLKMLSLGSGICSHELKFAELGNFKEILCLDLTEVLLNKAEAIASKKDLNNINFEVQNVNNYTFPKNYFDIVFFHASLHHFKNLDELLGHKVKQTLKKDGKLIMNEFVGATRLQFPRHQINAINKSLKILPKKYRKRYKLNLYKNTIYGPGLLRMIIADPSECVESNNIMPTIHKHYSTIFEANYGGNILMTTLKDLAHHFIELNDEKENILKQLFEFEDNYLTKYSSDFVFGIYKNVTINNPITNIEN
ncbi:MAG: class I SAM-dependent methyltransferase [Flavobacteriaceae bacterium]|nr:class I SAM-dependent methyltransferase [Flavobacteriaceae bacterium]